jgi:predicted acyl esterase
MGAFWLVAATAMWLPGQNEEPRVFVNFQEVTIPMRDGVKLQTVIMTPKEVKGPLPFLIDRTPYGVPDRAAVEKGFPAGRRWSYENYIVVAQNIRGRFKSEGKFVMGRPPHDPKDSKGVDETTDAWDTVDWLVKNVPNNNGRAGIAGTSYDGWTAVMAALDPHPALKAVIEQASPADQFLGDDFHHNGAFRLSYGFEYAALLETTAEENYHFQFDRADTYDWYLALGPLFNANERYFHTKLPTWNDFTHHHSYDAFWQRLAFAPYLNSVKAPIVHVAAGGTRRISTGRRRSTHGWRRTIPGTRITSWPVRGITAGGGATGGNSGRSTSAATLRSTIARRFTSRGSITGCADRASCAWPRRRCLKRAPIAGWSTTRGRRRRA